MDKVILCEHTGSMNRGCEAIIRSTSKILKEQGVNSIDLITAGYSQDIKAGLDSSANLIPVPKKSLFAKGLYFINKYIFRDISWGSRYTYDKLLKSTNKENIIFAVGGDLYCCNHPPIGSYGLVDVAAKRDLNIVFWGCSVDEKILTSPLMQKSVNEYDAICVRESLSYEILEQVVDDPSKIHLVCDPAFHLDVHEVELPNNFKEKNIVGINLSPLVFKDYNDSEDMTHKNIVKLIDSILDKTDMNVCLIPHVYNIEYCLQDYEVLKHFFDMYRKTGRVSIIDQEFTCNQLKYIISQCRFFVGARTHSMIAAYSTAVPSIALSYSIKSRGIAKDLFGSEEGYAIKWQDMSEETYLETVFFSLLVDREDEILSQYEKTLPQYKETILTAVKTILENR